MNSPEGRVVITHQDIEEATRNAVHQTLKYSGLGVFDPIDGVEVDTRVLAQARSDELRELLSASPNIDI